MKSFVFDTESFMDPITGRLFNVGQLPDLKRGYIWEGGSFNRPRLSSSLISVREDINSLFHAQFVMHELSPLFPNAVKYNQVKGAGTNTVSGEFIMGHAAVKDAYPDAQFLTDLSDGLLKKTDNKLEWADPGKDYLDLVSKAYTEGNHIPVILPTDPASDPLETYNKIVTASKLTISYYSDNRDNLSNIHALDSVEVKATDYVKSQQVKLYNHDDFSTAHFVSFKAPNAITNDIIWTLPDTLGTNGQFLIAGDDGHLQFHDGNYATSDELEQEKEDRKAADEDLKTKIDVEKENRIAEDEALEGEIVTLEGELVALQSEVDALIVSEIVNWGVTLSDFILSELEEIWNAITDWVTGDSDEKRAERLKEYKEKIKELRTKIRASTLRGNYLNTANSWASAAMNDEPYWATGMLMDSYYHLYLDRASDTDCEDEQEVKNYINDLEQLNRVTDYRGYGTLWFDSTGRDNTTNATTLAEPGVNIYSWHSDPDNDATTIIAPVHIGLFGYRHAKDDNKRSYQGYIFRSEFDGSQAPTKFGLYQVSRDGTEMITENNDDFDKNSLLGWKSSKAIFEYHTSFSFQEKVACNKGMTATTADISGNTKTSSLNVTNESNMCLTRVTKGLVLNYDPSSIVAEKGMVRII